MSHEKTHLMCAACMDPRGHRQIFKDKEPNSLQKMEDMDLVKEAEINAMQIGVLIGQLSTISQTIGISAKMINQDLDRRLERFEAINFEIQRRFIP